MEFETIYKTRLCTNCMTEHLSVARTELLRYLLMSLQSIREYNKSKLINMIII